MIGTGGWIVFPPLSEQATSVLMQPTVNSCGVNFIDNLQLENMIWQRTPQIHECRVDDVWQV